MNFQTIRSKLSPVSGVSRLNRGLRNWFRGLSARKRKQLMRGGILAANLVAIIAVIGIVSTSRTPVISQNALIIEEDATSPLDQLSAADIAVHVARMTGIEQAVAVVNQADSISAQQTTLTTDVNVTAKPQIIATQVDSIRELSQYTVQEGDTVASLAKTFNITSASIRASNSLDSDAIVAGDVLWIPPVSGIVYEVKDGDTADSLADTYSSDANRIIAFNDAELTGLVAGSRIVIPGGELPPPVVRYVAPVYAYGGYALTYGYNGYDYGQCTWHTANRRAEIGRPIPANLGNANTWSARARAGGLTVSDTPTVGAVMWHDQSIQGIIAGGYGHVAFVEQVNADGSILVSDMNYGDGYSNPGLTGNAYAGGWGRVSYRIVQPTEFFKYDFIY